jgi:hypothetical protein
MRVDIYSAAIVMWEVLTGAIPWKGMDIVQIIHQVMHNIPVSLNHYTSGC